MEQTQNTANIETQQENTQQESTQSQNIQTQNTNAEKHTQEQNQTQNTTLEQKNAVPEKYDYQKPDAWNDEYCANVERIAKENNLSNEQMKVFAAYAQKEHEKFLETRQENMQRWENELKQDPDFAGENFKNAVQYAGMGLKHIDTNGDLQKVLEESGYGSHPAVVRAMYKIGKMLDNDNNIKTTNNAVKDVPLWDRLYKK